MHRIIRACVLQEIHSDLRQMKEEKVIRLESQLHGQSGEDSAETIPFQVHAYSPALRRCDIVYLCLSRIVLFSLKYFAASWL